MRGHWVGLLLMLASGGGLVAGQEPVTLPEAQRIIDGLRQSAHELNEASRRFRTHLDEAIARFDRDQRGGGNQIEAADPDDAEAGATQDAVRKSFIARMLAARNGNDEPLALADLDCLQEMIRQARSRVEASQRFTSSLLLVSVTDLKTQNSAHWKLTIDQLRKARAAAQRTIEKASLILPFDLLETGSLEPSN